MERNYPSYSQYFVLRDERPRWTVFAAALALTALMVFLIRLGLTVSSDRETAAPQSADLVVIPVQSPPPPAPGPVQPVMSPPLASVPAPPAPAAPAFMPPAEIVLSRDLMRPSEAVPVLPVHQIGNSVSSTPGNGSADGNGASAGNGRGGGGVALPPANLRVSWAPQMRMRWLRDYYPEEALAAGTRALVVMNCEVLAGDRVRDCRVMSESPRGQGFGEAALAAQNVYLVRVHDQDGNRLYNRRFRLRALFYPDGVD